MATLNIKKFPDELYQELQRRARERHRSVAQEAVHILSEAVGQLEPRSLLELKGLGKRVWDAVDADDHVDAERDAWE